MIARQQQLELEEIASQSGASLIAGSSLKAVLDLDWDEPEVRTQALKTILQTLNQVELWVEQEADLHEPTIEKAKKNLEVARQIEAQDVEHQENGDILAVNWKTR